MTTTTKGLDLNPMNDAGYRTASDKAQELRGELAACDEAINNVTAARARRVRASDMLRSRATALLDGEPDPADDQPTREQLGDLYDRRVLLRAAIELQDQRATAEHRRVSGEIIAAARPGYSEIVKRMAHAIEELARVAEEERVFRERLLDAGIAGVPNLPPMPYAQLGRLADSYSDASRWLREAREAGLI